MDQFLQIIKDFYDYISKFDDSTRVVIAIVVFLLFYFLRTTFTKRFIKLMLRITLQTKTEVDERLLIAFKKPLKALFLVVGIYISLRILKLNPVLLLATNKMFRIALIILITWGAYNFTSNTVRFFTQFQDKVRRERNELIGRFIEKILRVIIVSLGFVLVFSELGYNVTGFITGLGIGGLAFALAAKDTAANIFGGIVIILDQPFKIGDWIDTPKVEGTVEDINLRSTKVRTFANAQVIVPNADLTSDPITNWSRMKKRRITFKLGVTYNTPKEKIEIIMVKIRELLHGHKDIHQKTIFVNLDEFSDSSIDIFLYFFTKTTNWGEFLEVKEKINLEIIKIMQEEEVSFAFPSRSIYIENNEKELEEKTKVGY